MKTDILRTVLLLETIYIKSRNHILFNKVLIHFDKILGKIAVAELEGTHWPLTVHLKKHFFLTL